MAIPYLPRMTPAWVLGLAQERRGTEPCFIMAKTLTKTDLDAEQNRLLIPAGFMKAHLIPFLSYEERAAANLLDPERTRKKSTTGDEGRDTKKKEAGRKHGGLRVPVYVGATMWKAYVMMTRWDSSNGTILKGDEYSRYLARWSGVKVGDKVELWGFREGETGMPCFVLHRIKDEANEGV